MGNKKFFALFLGLVFVGNFAFSQEKPASSEDKPAEEVKKPIAAKSNVKKERVPHEFQLNVHAGAGFLLFRGDIQDNAKTNIHRLGNRLGYNFGIGATINRFLDVQANVLIGKLNGNERNRDVPSLNRNFQSNLFAVGVDLEYNFGNLWIWRDPRVVSPIVGGGVYFSTYDVYKDLQDSEGNTYHYWTGESAIFNVDESAPQTEDVQQLLRDFEYESKVYDSPVSSVAFPVFGGFDFNLSRKWAFRVKAGYFFTLTDKIDGFDEPSSSKNLDGFFYSNISVFFKFNPFKKRVKGEVPSEYLGDFGDDIVSGDSDGDGINDFVDQCSGTPTGVEVDQNGCPKDKDGDGIPDYKDKEPSTAPGYVVDENGSAISYQQIYEKYQRDTVNIKRKNVDKDWLFSQVPTDSKYTVHVGTFTNYDIPTQLKMKLSAMTGLTERKVNDSVSVFTLGKFDNFEAAEEKQNQLIKSGIDQAFGVNEGVLDKVATDISTLKVEGPIFSNRTYTEKKEIDVLVYGVQLREYRLRLDLDKLSRLIAKYGVEMRVTSGGTKIYTIGAFETYDETEKLRKEVARLGVKDPEVKARLNNKPIPIDQAKKEEERIKAEQGQE